MRYELAIDACSPVSQSHGGLHQKKHSQQVEGGDSPKRSSLLQSCETPLRVLHPALRLLGQERHGSVRVGPEIVMENDQSTAAPLL